MSNETEYTIPKGVLSTRKVQSLDDKKKSSVLDEEGQEKPSAPVASEALPLILEEQTPIDQPLPWELLDHIKKPTEPVLPKGNPSENVVTTLSGSALVAQKKVEEHSRKPILKFLKSNKVSATQQSTDQPPVARKNVSIEIPQPVRELLKKSEADKKILLLFKTFIEDLPHICTGRITLSTQDDTICIWNYDEGVPFSFFRIMDGSLCCGVESSLIPEEETIEIWQPPRWLFPESVSFFLVTETTPMIFNRIEQASLAATLTTTKMAL